MEIARIILEYISTLIWPVTLLIIVLRFQVPLKQVFERLLSRSNQINFEVGGQRLSFILAKEAVREAIDNAVSSPGIEKDSKKLNEIASNTSKLLSVLAKMNNNDVNALSILTEKDSHTSLQSQELSNLVQLGLVFHDDKGLAITEMGKRIKALVDGRDVDETLHKISQAL